jgi:hypothetical protein
VLAHNLPEQLPLQQLVGGAAARLRLRRLLLLLLRWRLVLIWGWIRAGVLHEGVPGRLVSDDVGERGVVVGEAPFIVCLVLLLCSAAEGLLRMEQTSA